jgi:hypothetical protein
MHRAFFCCILVSKNENMTSEQHYAIRTAPSMVHWQYGPKRTVQEILCYLTFRHEACHVLWQDDETRDSTYLHLLMGTNTYIDNWSFAKVGARIAVDIKMRMVIWNTNIWQCIVPQKCKLTRHNWRGTLFASNWQSQYSSGKHRPVDH